LTDLPFCTRTPRSRPLSAKNHKKGLHAMPLGARRWAGAACPGLFRAAPARVPAHPWPSGGPHQGCPPLLAYARTAKPQADGGWPKAGPSKLSAARLTCSVVANESIPRRKSTGLAVTNMRRPERTDIIAWSALPRTPPAKPSDRPDPDTDANIAQLDLNHAALVHHRRRRRVTGHHHRYECRAASHVAPGIFRRRQRNKRPGLMP
jgi:hypothetical protein